LPVPAWQSGRGGRPEAHCRRAVVDAIRYVVHNGCVWRAVPAGFPPWRTVYGLFQRWNVTGVTIALHDALHGQARRAAGCNTEPTAAVIDSQSVRAAATVPKASRGWDNAKKVNGRKRHIAVGTGGLLLEVLATPASVQDRDGARPLLFNLHRARRRVRHAWADAVYAGKLQPWAATYPTSPPGSSGAPKACMPSKSCRAAGSSSGLWPGSPATAAAPATTNASPQTTKPPSTGP
jgi:transposase